MDQPNPYWNTYIQNGTITSLGGGDFRTCSFYNCIYRIQYPHEHSYPDSNQLWSIRFKADGRFAGSTFKQYAMNSAAGSTSASDKWDRRLSKATTPSLRSALSLPTQRQQWNRSVGRWREKQLTRLIKEFIISRWFFPYHCVEGFSCKLRNSGKMICVALRLGREKWLSGEEKEGCAAQHPDVDFLRERRRSEDHLRRTEGRWVLGGPSRFFVDALYCDGI